jgi:hypothetical protein
MAGKWSQGNICFSVRAQGGVFGFSPPVLGFELRALWLLDRHFSTWTTSTTLFALITFQIGPCILVLFCWYWDLALARQAFCHLSHAPSSFSFMHFPDRTSRLCPGSLDCDPPIHVPAQQGWQLWLRWALHILFPELSWNLSPPAYACPVAEITSVVPPYPTWWLR